MDAFEAGGREAEVPEPHVKDIFVQLLIPLLVGPGYEGQEGPECAAHARNPFRAELPYNGRRVFDPPDPLPQAPRTGGLRYHNRNWRVALRVLPGDLSKRLRPAGRNGDADSACLRVTHQL